MKRRGFLKAMLAAPVIPFVGKGLEKAPEPEPETESVTVHARSQSLADEYERDAAYFKHDYRSNKLGKLDVVINDNVGDTQWYLMPDNGLNEFVVITEKGEE